MAPEGDGSLLMQLGGLTTVARQAPRNLTIIVWDNGIYQITARQLTASVTTVDLVAIAREAGIANSAWAADEEDFNRFGLRRARQFWSERDCSAHRWSAGSHYDRPRPGTHSNKFLEGTAP